AVLCRGSYVVAPPRPVEDVSALELAPDALVAFDCPIGLPDVYAAKAGLPSFRAALRTFGAGRFDRFYDFAGAPAEIAIERPFYPRRGIKGTTRDHLRSARFSAAASGRRARARIPSTRRPRASRWPGSSSTGPCRKRPTPRAPWKAGSSDSLRPNGDRPPRHGQTLRAQRHRPPRSESPQD